MTNKVSLYSRLFKYKQSVDRSETENFLTEMLCDALNRLNENEVREFFIRVLYFNLNQIHFSDWFEQNVSGAEIFWTSQYCINSTKAQGEKKLIDLVCLRQGLPIVAIEAKIRAKFQRDQLETYGLWLSDVNPNGILVLLTARTEAPSNFPADPYQFGAVKKIVVQWQTVFDWLLHLEDSHSLRPFSFDFRTFMEDYMVAFEEPTSSDFAAIECVANGQIVRLGNLMKNLQVMLSKDFGHLDWGRESSYLPDGYTLRHGGLVLSWCFVKNYQYTWFGWGYAFPSNKPDKILNEVFKDQGPKYPVMIFLLSSNDETLWAKLGSSLIQSSHVVWNESKLPSKGSENVKFIAHRPLTDFLASKTSLFNESLLWVRDWMSRTLACIDEKA